MLDYTLPAIFGVYVVFIYYGLAPQSKFVSHLRTWIHKFVVVHIHSVLCTVYVDLSGKNNMWKIKLVCTIQFVHQ